MKKWRNHGQWKPKSSTHWGLDSKSHWEIISQQLIVWLSSVYGPSMPVCTPDNVWGCSWWGRTLGSWGISSHTQIRASVSSWKVCGGMWRQQMHQYPMSHKYSLGFRSGEQKGQSMASMPSSSRNCLRNLSTGIVLQDRNNPGPAASA